MKNNQTQNSIKPVKTISGEVLLYLYWMHRENIGKLKDVRLTFGLHRSENIVLDRREASIFSVDKFKEYSDNDLFAALQYLSDLYLIEYKDSPDNTGSNFFNFKVTAHGVQIVEGVQHSQEEKNQFNMTFNFNLENNVTIESLLKAELGSLFKASLI